MAIIYTYPTKATPNDNDLILISDSEDSNKTKQVKISTLPGGSGSGVSSVTAVLPLASTGGSTPAISLTGLTGFGTAGQVIKVNSGADGLEWGAAGGSTSPDTPTNSVQFNNAGAFGGSANLTFSTNTLAVTHTVDIKGDGTNAGKLKLYCENTSTPHAVTIEGPAHANAAAYTLKLPSPAPASNQILEYENSTNNLRWIATPTSSGSVSITADNTSTDYVDIQVAPSTITGTGTVMADLNAVDGTSDTTTRFLSKDNTWDIPSYTAAYTAGTGLSLTGTSFANTDLGSSQNIYKNFAATSGGTAVANTNNDTLTLSAGSGITTTRSGDTITIAATGGSAATGGQTPVDYAVSTGFEATGGNVQYFYIFTCHGNFTLNRMYWYQNNSASQVVTWAIYQGDLSSATLLGQGSATATQTAVNYVTMTAEEGQNLSLVKGNTYVIGHQQGGQNGSVACLTSANPNSGLAVTYAGASGFPASFPGAELTYTATGIRPCVSLVP